MATITTLQNNDSGLAARTLINTNFTNLNTDKVEYNNLIVVQSSSDFGVIDPSKIYFIDGVIDMTGVSIEVPTGGITLTGHNFDISKLVCADDNYTMFTSPVGGSGNILGENYAIEVTGTNSKIYDITGNTGSEAFEFLRINFNNCTSLGKITNYRQGLEEGTGRFGGTPTLELDGTWAGGYRITTSIVRSLDAAMNAPLFKAGPTFSMESRFLTDINADLGATASLFDFSSSDFPNPSTIQIRSATITRDGVQDATDATLVPNVLASDLACSWRDNVGLDNTYVGGKVEVTAEAVTTINTQGVYEDIVGTFTTSLLEHFDSPAAGQLRHLGNNPRDYNVVCDLVVDASPNDELVLKLVKWDDSAAGFVDVGTQRRVVNSLVGGRDVAFFTALFPATLDNNDYLKLQVANNSGTANITVENGSFMLVSER